MIDSVQRSCDVSNVSDEASESDGHASWVRVVARRATYAVRHVRSDREAGARGASLQHSHNESEEEVGTHSNVARRLVSAVLPTFQGTLGNGWTTQTGMVSQGTYKTFRRPAGSAARLGALPPDRGRTRPARTPEG